MSRLLVRFGAPRRENPLVRGVNTFDARYRPLSLNIQQIRASLRASHVDHRLVGPQSQDLHKLK